MMVGQAGLGDFEEPTEPDEADEAATTDRLLRVLRTVHRRDQHTHTFHQGAALNRVLAVRRKIDARPLSEWKVVEIEGQLYDLSRLFESFEVRGGGSVPGNCKRLAREAEAIHQDLIEELRERDRYSADWRQHLTNQFGSVCDRLEYGDKLDYGASNHFEAVEEATDISDRIADIFEDGDGVRECAAQRCSQLITVGPWDKCADCDEMEASGR